MLKIGIKGNQEVIASQENSAKTMGSGSLEVFATPAMIALMEKTAAISVAEYLKEGEGTVGTKVDIKHISATPLGMRVTCQSELVAIDDRKLIFIVKAYDERGLIGEGEHQRFVIHEEKFQEKTNSK